MTRPVAVLRPEPGNAATAARLAAAGLTVIRLPLFAVSPIGWHPPDPAAHDAILFTSANAPRFGGTGLAALSGLPAFAIGGASAAAARDAGFTVAATGAGDWRALYARAAADGVRRGLLLTGRDHAAEPAPPVTAIVPVYASEARAVAPDRLTDLSGSVALLHSARAAARFAALVPDRAAIRIAALSLAILTAAGSGWAAVAVAERPDDAALIDLARRLAD